MCITNITINTKTGTYLQSDYGIKDENYTIYNWL